MASIGQNADIGIRKKYAIFYPYSSCRATLSVIHHLQHLDLTNIRCQRSSRTINYRVVATTLQQLLLKILDNVCIVLGIVGFQSIASNIRGER
jgi:hypothetical protein